MKPRHHNGCKKVRVYHRTKSGGLRKISGYKQKRCF